MLFAEAGSRKSAALCLVMVLKDKSVLRGVSLSGIMADLNTSHLLHLTSCPNWVTPCFLVIKCKERSHSKCLYQIKQTYCKLWYFNWSIPYSVQEMVKLGVWVHVREEHIHTHTISRINVCRSLYWICYRRDADRKRSVAGTRRLLGPVWGQVLINVPEVAKNASSPLILKHQPVLDNRVNLRLGDGD